MSRKQTEIPTETVAAEEIYKTARAAADRDLAEMREKMNLSNELGLIAGRIQAYKSIELLSEYLGYKQLAKIIDNKEFKKIPGITSIDDYLEQLGIGRSTAYNNLKIARTLTVEEVKLLDKVGFTRRDLLGYASLPDEARMEIRDGKVINLEKADKEEIRKVIEDIILENKKVKEDTDAEIRVRDREIASKRELIKKQEKELALFEKQALVRGLTPDEDAFVKRIEAYKIMAQGSLIAMEPAEIRNEFPDLSPRMRAALISSAHYLKMQILALYDTLVTEVGDPTMNPELLEDYSRWAEQNGFK